MRAVLVLALALQSCALGPLACSNLSTGTIGIPAGTWHGIGFRLLLPAGDLCRPFAPNPEMP